VRMRRQNEVTVSFLVVGVAVGAGSSIARAA